MAAIAVTMHLGGSLLLAAAGIVTVGLVKGVRNGSSAARPKRSRGM